MPDLDLDDVRLKEPEDLSDEEKTFLKENEADLTDDEKETYKESLEAEDKGEEEEEEEESKGLSFESEEELDKYLDRYSAGREKKAAEADKGKGEDEDVPDYFPAGYKPKDWNEPFKQYTPKMREMMREEIRAERTEESNRKEKLNKEFDAEIETLRGAHKEIPAIGTPERATFEKDLAQVIVAYPGVRNMTEAYNIKTALDSAGGGSKGKTDTKGTARKVGSSGGEGGGEEGKPKSLHKDMDAAQDAALTKLESLS